MNASRRVIPRPMAGSPNGVHLTRKARCIAFLLHATPRAKINTFHRALRSAITRLGVFSATAA